MTNYPTIKKSASYRNTKPRIECSRKQTILNDECNWKPDRSVRSQSELIVAPYLNAKNSVRIRILNVRTMWETARSPQVVKIMREYRLDILGISMCSWTSWGRNRVRDGVEILYSRMPEGGPHFLGVSLILSSYTASWIFSSNLILIKKRI